MTTKKCYRCNSPSHLSKDCEKDIVCHFCGESGHVKKDCESYVNMLAGRQYGEYAAEILEGQRASAQESEMLEVQQTDDFQQSTPIHDTVQRNLDFDTSDPGERLENNEHVVSQNENNIDVLIIEHTEDNNVVEQSINKSEHADKMSQSNISRSQQHVASSRAKTKQMFSEESVNIVLGDSNALRVHFKDPDVYNISIPGASAAGIESLLEKAVTKTKNKHVKRIAMHLGTNDITKQKTDPNQVILETSTVIGKVHTQYPDAEIAFSSILQRRG